jgi:hypothetical protein
MGVFHDFTGIFALKSLEIMNYATSFLIRQGMSASHVGSLSLEPHMSVGTEGKAT